MDVISSEVTVHFSDSGKAVTDQDLFFFFSFREVSYLSGVLIDLSTCI